MTELVLAWQWLWLRLAYRHSSRETCACQDIRDLIERADFDLRHGWVEAAQDALGQALQVLDFRGNTGTTNSGNEPTHTATDITTWPNTPTKTPFPAPEGR